MTTSERALLEHIETILEYTLANSSKASQDYSPESERQLAFEVGYLSGGIKTALSHIQERLLTNTENL